MEPFPCWLDLVSGPTLDGKLSVQVPKHDGIRSHKPLGPNSSRFGQLDLVWATASKLKPVLFLVA